MAFEKILSNHKKWLKNSLRGCRMGLQNANLRGVDLQGEDLTGVILIDSDLREADLSHTNLSGAILIDSDLRGANLTESNLRGADLRDVDLRGVIMDKAILHNVCMSGCLGNQLEIKTLSCGDYSVAYTSTHLEIECECHPIEDWWEFDDHTILSMGGEKALKGWNKWKDSLKISIEKSPATPTK